MDMQRIGRSDGYGKKSDWIRLAIPPAIQIPSVCSLSADVFIFSGTPHG